MFINISYSRLRLKKSCKTIPYNNNYPKYHTMWSSPLIMLHVFNLFTFVLLYSLRQKLSSTLHPISQQTIAPRVTIVASILTISVISSSIKNLIFQSNCLIFSICLRLFLHSFGLSINYLDKNGSIYLCKIKCIISILIIY